MNSITVHPANSYGNQFLLPDLVDKGVTSSSVNAIVNTLVNSATSPNFDQIATLARHKLLARGDNAAHFTTQIFNVDESESGFCTNAVRALAEMAVKSGYVQRNETFVLHFANGQKVHCKFSEERNLWDSTLEISDFHPELKNAPAGYQSMHQTDIGNPHCTLIQSNNSALALQDINLPALAKEVETQVGAEVNVLVCTPEAAWQKNSDSISLAARVHERGVGETDSCGSALIVASLVLNDITGSDAFKISTPGGESTLLVNHDRSSDSVGVTLRGGTELMEPFDLPLAE